MKLFLVVLLAAPVSVAQEKVIQPRVHEIVDAVSEERIAATIQKLVTFETRNTLSTQGVAGARQWIAEEMKGYSPRLQVSLEHFKVKKNEDRVFRDVDLYNVVAVLPGTSTPETQVLITGHYDSLNLVPLPGRPAVEPDDNVAERPNYDCHIKTSSQLQVTVEEVFRDLVAPVVETGRRSRLDFVGKISSSNSPLRVWKVPVKATGSRRGSRPNRYGFGNFGGSDRARSNPYQAGF